MTNTFTPQILKIAFFAHNVPWAHKIRQNLTENEKERYPSTSLPKLERSISQKLFNLTTLIDETNLEMININKELRERKEEVDENIRRGTAFIFKEPHRIIKILAFTEAAISTTKTITELLHKYSEEFYEVIFGRRRSDLLNDMEEKNIDIDWINEIADIRNDLLHNYAAWLFFQETDTAFTFGLALPEEMQGRNWESDSLTIDQLNNFFSDFQESYNKLTDLLVEKIQERNQAD